MSQSPLANSAQAQIARLLGSKGAVAPIAAAPAAASARAYVPACEQVAALFGSSKPSPDQIAAKRASSAGAASTGVSPSELRLLAELEDANALSAELKSLADQTHEVFDMASAAGVARGMTALTRPAANRNLIGHAAAAGNSGRSCAGSGAGASSAASAACSPVWSRLGGGGISGALSISQSNSILNRLRGVINAAVPLVAVSESRGADSELKTGGQTLQGTTAILYALFPNLIGDTPATNAKVVQWCMDGVDPKYAAAESEKEKDVRKAKISKLIEGLDCALGETAYLAGDSLTIADLVVWASTRNIFPQLHGELREASSNMTRWYKHIQAAPGLTAQPVVISSNYVTPLGAH